MPWQGLYLFSGSKIRVLLGIQSQRWKYPRLAPCRAPHVHSRYTLFDKQKPVLESLVLPLQRYGLKDICMHKDLVNFQWEDDDSGSQWSVVQFNRLFGEPDPATKESLKADILGYNRDDVIATRRLEERLRTNFIA